MATFKIKTPQGNYTINAPDEQSAMNAVGLGGGGSAAPQEEGTFSKYAGAVGSGLTAAAAGIADLPVTAMRVWDKADAKLQGREPLPIDWNYWSPGAAIDKLLRPEGDGETTYDVVKNVAPFVTGSALTGGYAGKAADKALQLVKDTGKAGAAYAGATGGQVAGEVLGGDVGGEVGALLGSGIAPGLPGMAKTAGKNFLVDLLTDDKSLSRWRSVERLNKAAEQNGQPDAHIPLSLGLVGSKTAGVVEDSTAGTLGGGAPAMETRRDQRAGMDQTAKAIADETRGGAAASEISVGSLGDQIAQMARDANEGFTSRVSARQDALENAIGPRVTDVTGPAKVLDDYINDPNHLDALKDGARARRDQLNNERKYPVDPSLDSQLRHLLNVATSMIPQAAAQGMLLQLTRHIKNLNEQIWANTGARYGVVKDWRTVLGKEMENAPALEMQVRGPTYDKATEAMRQEAIMRGVGQEFDAAQEEAARLHQGPLDPNGKRVKAEAPIPVTERIGEQDAGPAYNSLFSPSNSQSQSLLRIFKEGEPNKLLEVLANNLELKLRGAGAGIQRPTPESFDPKRGANWLMSQRDSVLGEYAPDPANGKRLTDLGNVMQADARRPTRTLPGQGGNTIGAPQMYYGLLGSALGGGLGGPIGALAASVGLPLAVGKAMTSPAVVRSTVLARRGPREGVFDGLPQNAIPGIIANQPVPVEQQ